MRERRHRAYAKPEILAMGPNQVWSWDITKVKGPGRGVYYPLYVALDIYNRYVVGWRLEYVGSYTLAEDLLCAGGNRAGAADSPCGPGPFDEEQGGLGPAV